MMYTITIDRKTGRGAITVEKGGQTVTLQVETVETPVVDSDKLEIVVTPSPIPFPPEAPHAEAPA